MSGNSNKNMAIQGGGYGFMEGMTGSESPAAKEGSASHKLKSGRLRLDVTSPTTIPDVGPDYGTSVNSAESGMSEVGYGWFNYDENIDSDMGRSQGSAHADHISVLQKLESMRDMDPHTPTSPTPSSVGSHASPSRTTNGRHSMSASLRSGKKRVLFNLSQKNFNVCTKVFEDYRTCRTYFMALGLGGFRIVQTTAGQHAEYNVIICMNNQTYCIWKRYNHFVELMKEAQYAQSRRHLRKSIESWEYMESRRKWWRCLDIRYLAQKLSHIEAFLKELVYEIRSPTVLIKFASEVVSPMDGHPTTEAIFLRHHQQPHHHQEEGHSGK